MRRFTALILTGLIIALPLCGCKNNVKADKNNELALEVTKNFVEELECNNFVEVKKCYSTNLKEYTDILGELKNTGKTDITKYDQTNLEFIKVKKCSTVGKKGKVTSDYTLNIGKVKIDCTFEFDVVKVNGEWYLDNDPEINSSEKNKNYELSKAETIELAVKNCQADISAKANDIFNNDMSYIDLDGNKQTVPNSSDENESKTISVYDVVGAYGIYEAITPIIYNSKMYEPYWKSGTDGDICIYMNSDNDIISEYDDITINTNDTITPLTKNGIPRNDVYVCDLGLY